MELDTSKRWKKLIFSYIDSVDDIENKRQIIYYLKVRLYYEAIESALLVSQNKSAEILKIIESVRKKPLTFKDFNKTSEERRKAHLEFFENTYKKFLENNWITSINETISYVESLSDFYKIWIFYALAQMKNVTHATHVPKLTHSSNKGVALVDCIDTHQMGLLTTSSLEVKIFDGAYPDAKLSPIAKFLLLDLDGQILGEQLKNGDNTAFRDIVTNDELKMWSDAFYRCLNPQPRADALAKQIYFPIDSTNEYHLLIILKSSSLIHSIYDKYFSKEVRKERDKIYKQREKGKYSADILQSLPNVVTLATVMSQPQNVSVNNGSRGGNIRLFNSAPPVWQSQLNPPIKLKSMFNARLLNRYAYDNIVALRKMLMTFDDADISFKDPNRLKGVSNWVKAIAHNVIDYSQTLAILPAGWTNDTECNLPIAQQIFLDFDRNDDEFVKLKRQNDWQGQLVKDFVIWLNKTLKGKNNEFIASSEHSRVWRDIFANILREHMEVIEVDSSNWQNNQTDDSSMQKEATV